MRERVRESTEKWKERARDSTESEDQRVRVRETAKK